MRRAAVIVAVFVVAGAGAGVLWELLWTPPQGVALDDQFVFTSSGLTSSFSGTALHAVIGFATGLLLGAGVAARAGDRELASLGGVVVGSLLAAVVMTVVGTSLGPPDVDEAVQGREDYTLVEQDLRVQGAAAHLGFPAGALLGLGGVFLSLSRRRAHQAEPERTTGVGHASSPDAPHDSPRDPGDRLGEGAPPR